MISGLYYQTIVRNVFSGETEFYIIPDSGYNIETKNGLLRCRGKIGIIVKNMPIELEGNYKNNEYIVSSSRIPTCSKESTFRLLNYIDDSITPHQKEVIANTVNNDLLGFMDEAEKRNILIKALSSKKTLLDLANGTASNETVAHFNKIVTIVDKIIITTEKLLNQEELVRQLMIYGVDIGKIEMLCNKGIDLKKIISNPYMILLPFGIPIIAAEMVAYNNDDMDDFDIRRLCGFVYDSLNYVKERGNTCCEFQDLLKIVNNRIEYYGTSGSIKVIYSKSMLHLCIRELKKYMEIHVINNEALVYFNSVWKEEISAVENIKRIQTAKKPIVSDVSIRKIEEKFGITYNEQQKNAFKAMDSSGIKILTGPPGSGKTSVIRGFIEYFSKDKNFKLAATTGMAAKVMAEACHFSAETVNKMLELRLFGESVTGKNLNNPIEADLIIVDEVSMLGLQLFSALLKAVKSGSILLLVGDEDQLQSVDYGNVLHDLINSGIIEVYRLTEILRQDGTIRENGIRINNGNCNLITDDSFIVKHFDSDKEAVTALLEDTKDISGEREILSPTKIFKKYGTNYLNRVLQPRRSEVLVAYGDTEYRLHDKIVMTKNNYDKNYINGDLGEIIGYKNGILQVQFHNKVVDIFREDMCNMSLAYAITIHKSQGSEFDEVYIILQDSVSSMLTRRLLYTSVTRARKKVVVYDVNDCINKAISNTNDNFRKTGWKNIKNNFAKNFHI